MKLGKNQFISKLLIAVCVFLLLGCVICTAAEAANANIELEVEISPVESTYFFAQHSHAQLIDHAKLMVDTDDTNVFLVRFRVSNPTNPPCAIAVMTCSTYGSWQTDSTNVFVKAWDCDHNFPHGILLGAYSGEIPILVTANTKPGNITFRMCFTSVKKEECIDNWSRAQKIWAEGTYWSNPVTITVVP
jgi:hypothetical protein